MGKGLALQIKKTFPDVFADYARACKQGAVEVGRVREVKPRIVDAFEALPEVRVILFEP
jgi:hypothetical protein